MMIPANLAGARDMGRGIGRRVRRRFKDQSEI